MAKESFYYVLTAKWIGAAFFWLVKGFKGKYSDQMISKYDSRNIWTGYVINIIAVSAILYWLFVGSL